MSFTFYATFSLDDLRPEMPSVPVMLPASSWARRGLSTPRLPETITERAADCGGFVATRIWGEYRYSAEEYVDWLQRWQPVWAATMDYCCEDEITTGKPGIVRERQKRTTEQAYHFWQRYRAVPWIWVPTLQGWHPEDYRVHAQELLPLLQEMQAYYGQASSWRVGVGTLCRRANVKMINQVLRAIRTVLPTTPLHLWGIKLAALKSLDLTHVVSSDSAAWHGLWGPRRQRLQEAAQAQGTSRRQYILWVQLPSYMKQVQAAVERTSNPETTAIDTSQARAVLRACGWTLHIRTRTRRQYVYLARRFGEIVKEYYLTDLPSLPNWSASDLQAKAQACLAQALGTTTSPRHYPTPDERPLGKKQKSADTVQRQNKQREAER
jgi:hypothetical protein